MTEQQNEADKQPGAPQENAGQGGPSQNFALIFVLIAAWFLIMFGGIYLVKGKMFDHKEGDAVQTMGMTWGIYPNGQMAAENLTLASCHGQPTDVTPDCNAYEGDTACNESRPLLCIKKTGQIKPSFLPFDKYAQWAGGEIKLTEAIKGTDLTSRPSADAICAEHFGKEWRMAEFHDGWGWGFWATGRIEPKQRFWVAISDQPANCWESAPLDNGDTVF
ncbi:MAG: hypothetical protein JWM96_360 [Alphaproteobacteria bacterium]|nr:hypothetical protein [Alphaproteobacteria bacterium]